MGGPGFLNTITDDLPDFFSQDGDWLTLDKETPSHLTDLPETGFCTAIASVSSSNGQDTMLDTNTHAFDRRLSGSNDPYVDIMLAASSSTSAGDCNNLGMLVLDTPVSRSLNTSGELALRLGEDGTLPVDSLGLLQVRRSRKPSAGVRKTTPTFSMKDGMSKFAVNRARRQFTPERRKEVALTRKLGACFACKLWKVTVGTP